MPTVYAGAALIANGRYGDVGAEMALAFVKQGGSTANKTTTAPSWTITVPAGGHAAGNLLVIATGWFPAGATITLSSVTDPRGNTYAILDPGVPSSTSNTGTMALAASRLTTALQAGDVITITTTAATGPSRWIVVSAEFSGASTTDDGGANTNSGGVLSQPTNSGSFTPSGATDLIIGGYTEIGPTGDTITEDSDNAGGDTWHTVPKAGTTGGSATTNISGGMSYKFTNSIASQQYGVGISATRWWIGMIAAIAPAPPKSLPPMGRSSPYRQLTRWHS